MRRKPAARIPRSQSFTADAVSASGAEPSRRAPCGGRRRPASARTAGPSLIVGGGAATPPSDPPLDPPPPGFTVSAFLGRGAFGVVYSATREDGLSVALKRVRADSAAGPAAVQSADQECVANAELWEASGRPHPRFLEHRSDAQAHADPVALRIASKRWPGLRHIARSLGAWRDADGRWLAFERCGAPLPAATLRVVPEFRDGRRLYAVHQTRDWAELRRPGGLAGVARSLLRAAAVLEHAGLIHADIKPDNVLVDAVAGTDRRGGRQRAGAGVSVRIIDFGSSCTTASPDLSRSRTPEYAPPEALSDGTRCFDAIAPHAFDMWSIGCVLLELIAGVPLWFSLPGRVVGPTGLCVVPHAAHSPRGLFASRLRNAATIGALQRRAVQNRLPGAFDGPASLFAGRKVPAWVTPLLIQLLALDPRARPRPEAALAMIPEAA